MDLVASPELLKIKLRLAPLLQVEETLIRRLTPAGSGEMEATLRIGRDMSYYERTKNYMKEVTVNSAVQWKGSFGRREAGRSSFDTDKAINWEDPDDPGRILHACSEDMIRLWEDPMTKKFLEAQKLRLQERAGLFAVLFILDGLIADVTIVFWILWNELRLPNTYPLTVRPFLSPISSYSCLGSPDDILKARLKTLGVTEHRFILSGSESQSS